jgi:hypothetical protein
MVKYIYILIWILSYWWFIVRIVFTQIVAFNDLGDDLINLSKKNCLFIFKIFDKELVWDNVSIRMTLVAILDSMIKVNSLYNEFYVQVQGFPFLLSSLSYHLHSLSLTVSDFTLYNYSKFKLLLQLWPYELQLYSDSIYLAPLS